MIKHCDGGIAQLARAPGSYPVGRKFKSHFRYQKELVILLALLFYYLLNLNYMRVQFNGRMRCFRPRDVGSIPITCSIFIISRSGAEVVITVLTRNQLEALLHVGSNPTHSAKIKKTQVQSISLQTPEPFIFCIFFFKSIKKVRWIFGAGSGNRTRVISLEG